jgi:hypothetical protein
MSGMLPCSNFKLICVQLIRCRDLLGHLYLISIQKVSKANVSPHNTP